MTSSGISHQCYSEYIKVIPSISLLPEAEKNIEIRVNGALTGYGELVEVDDKLGVEIHSWLSGNNNVK